MRPLPEIAVNFVKKFEGFSAKPYYCPAGVITIGYGHTSNVVSNMLMSEVEAAKLLGKDLNKLIDPVINSVGIMLNNNQLTALLSFCYNCGFGAFSASTLKAKILSNASVADITFQFNRWNKVHMHELPGLTYRRKQEAALYFTVC